MKGNSKSPTAELTCDKMCVQLIKHRAALGRAMRVCNDAIADIGTGKDDPSKAWFSEGNRLRMPLFLHTTAQ